MVELHKLRHIVEIARRGGFAKAAAVLHITQPALTKSVQSVEAELELRLFERGPRGVHLTPEGERFVERATRLLVDAEELEGEARALRTLTTGRVRVGAAPAPFNVLLLESVPAFAHRFPGVRIQTVADSVDAVARAVAHGELDFAIGIFEGLKSHADLVVDDLEAVPVEAFVRRGHPLDSRRHPTIDELLRYPMVGPAASAVDEMPHRSLLAELSREHRSPHPLPQVMVDSFTMQLRIVERTDCFSFVFARYGASASFAKRFRVWRGWRPLPPLAIGLLWRRGWQPAQAAERLLEIVRRRRGQTPLDGQLGSRPVR